MYRVLIMAFLIAIGGCTPCNSTDEKTYTTNKHGYRTDGDGWIVTDSGKKTHCVVDTINGRQYFICRTKSGYPVITPAGR